MSDKELPALISGTLYLVPTPIGNLEDITLRAIRTLRDCDLVAAEDTRRTGLLLKHLGFKKPFLSYHKFNETGRTEQLLNLLQDGKIIALVTDAGSPGISDPGETVVRSAIEAGLKVEALPGPCAFTTALSASGLPTTRFAFGGFVPRKTMKRLKYLEEFKAQPATIIFYESPFRIKTLLKSLMEVFPENQIVLAREITKKFEEYIRGTASELLAKYETATPKGEFAVLVDNN